MATVSPTAVSKKILRQLDRVLDMEPDDASYAAHAHAVEALVEAFVTMQEFVLDAPRLEDDLEDDDDEEDDDEDDDLEDEEGEEADDIEASDATLVLAGRR